MSEIENKYRNLAEKADIELGYISVSEKSPSTILAEYLTFIKTTDVGSTEDPYRYKHAIFEEIGEFAGKFKKWKRDGWTEEKFLEEASLELGDAIWYSLRFAQETGRDVLRFEYLSSCLDDVFFFSHRSLHRDYYEMTRIYMKIFNEETADRIFCEICYLACELGISPLCIIEKNMEKLKSRKERNAIRGEGDNR